MDAWIPFGVPMIFTSNKKPKKLFPKGKGRDQRAAIARRFTAFEIAGPLQAIGRPFTDDEMHARLEAGRNGPQLPPP